MNTRQSRGYNILSIIPSQIVCNTLSMHLLAPPSGVIFSIYQLPLTCLVTRWS